MGKITKLSDIEIKELLSNSLFHEWDNVYNLIKQYYNLNEEWYTAGKQGYELKFRKSNKTIVSLFPRKESIGLMIIFGKAEREKFDNQSPNYSKAITFEYNNAKTFHDGKWVMWQLPNKDLTDKLIEIISFKRKPDR